MLWTSGSHPKTCEMGFLIFHHVLYNTIICILQPLQFEIANFANIASVLSTLYVWETCRLKNTVKISNKDCTSDTDWYSLLSFGCCSGNGQAVAHCMNKRILFI